MTHNYAPFYHNLEEFANQGQEDYVLSRKILLSLDTCDHSEVHDPRFSSDNEDRPYKCICGVSIAETFPFRMNLPGRTDKTLYVGSKCIERVMKENIPTSLDFEQAVFNRCCHEQCDEIIRKRKVSNKIILHFCPQHRLGFNKFKCSGCPAWCLWNSGRPTHAYCPTCVNRFKRNRDKNYCSYCNKKLKNTSFKQCYDCFLKTYTKCSQCNKPFDSSMGQFTKCFKCNFNMK